MRKTSMLYAELRTFVSMAREHDEIFLLCLSSSKSFSMTSLRSSSQASTNDVQLKRTMFIRRQRLRKCSRRFKGKQTKGINSQLKCIPPIFAVEVRSRTLSEYFQIQTSEYDYFLDFEVFQKRFKLLMMCIYLSLSTI